VVCGCTKFATGDGRRLHEDMRTRVRVVTRPHTVQHLTTRSGVYLGRVSRG